MPASAIEARGGYRAAGALSLKFVTLGIAGGTVEASGVIALDDAGRTSRIEARWADIDLRRIPGAAGLAATISKSGTATHRVAC